MHLDVRARTHLLALFAVPDGGGAPMPFGSAIAIGNQLAFTAKHVIDEFGRPVRDGPHTHRLNAKIGCALSDPSKPSGGVVWSVNRVSFGISDVAILHLGPHPQSPGSHPAFPRLPMSLLPPAPGTLVRALGYPGMVASGDEMRLNVKAKVDQVEGRVVQVHDRFRDKGLLKFPCFEIDASFPHGMSGGPVFHARTGALLGLVTSSFSSGGGGHASSLWPAMATRMVEPALPHFTEFGLPFYHALDLACTGWIDAVGWEHVEVDSWRDRFETTTHARLSRPIISVEFMGCDDTRVVNNEGPIRRGRVALRIRVGDGTPTPCWATMEAGPLPGQMRLISFEPFYSGRLNRGEFLNALCAYYAGLEVHWHGDGDFAGERHFAHTLHHQFVADGLAGMP